MLPNLLLVHVAKLTLDFFFLLLIYRLFSFPGANLHARRGRL